MVASIILPPNCISAAHIDESLHQCLVFSVIWVLMGDHFFCSWGSSPLSSDNPLTLPTWCTWDTMPYLTLPCHTLPYHAIPYLTTSYLNTSPYQMEPIYLQRMHLRCTPPVAIKNQINEFHRNFKSSKMFDQFRRLLLETIEPIDWTTVNGPRYRQQDVKTLIRVIFHAWQHRNSGMKSGDFSSGCLKRSLREFKVVLMPVQPKGLPWVVDSLLSSSSFSSLS